MMSNSNGTQTGSILSFTTGPDIGVEQPVDTNLVDGAATVNFNDALVSTPSAAKTFTVKNTGSLSLTSLVITKDGSHADDFTVSALGSTTVVPGGSTTFTVTFTPGALGARSTAIHIASNDADENPFDINLTGNGVATLPLPAYTFTNSTSSSSYNTYTMGSRFTVNTACAVSSLGVYDHNQDGISGNVQVGLWSSGGTLLASTTVSNANPLVGVFRYNDITPVLLTVGQSYLIGALNNGIDRVAHNTPGFVVDSRITYNESRYNPGNGFTFPVYSGGGTFYMFGGMRLSAPAPTNAAPSIARTNASVTVNEGTQAANSGTFSDAQGNGTATLTASLGAVTKNDAAGTWSWSHTPTDGPAGPTTVTITATDNGSPPLTSTATFSLTVNNVAPSYDLGANVFLTAAAYRATVPFTDPGADSWNGTVNYGDGTGSEALSINGPAKTFSLSHTYAQPGVYTVTTTLNDDDGGTQNDTVEVDVILSPTVASGSASLVTAYTAHLSSSVRPNRGTTNAYYQYSPDSTFTTGVLATASQNLGNGQSFVAIEADLLQLKADTLYFFRVVAENASGISTGSTFNFRTSYPVSSDVNIDATAGLGSAGDLYRPMAGVINAAGRISFKAFGTVGAGGTTTANDAWLMSDTSGSLVAIGQEGTAVPGGGSLSGTFNNLVLSTGGRTVTGEKFAAATTAADFGYLISEDGSGLELLSREGDSVLGGGLFTEHTGRQAVDDSDRVYFPGALSGVVTNKNSGVWYDEAGSPALYAKEGLDVTSQVGDPAWLGNVSLTLSAAGDGVAFTTLLQNNPDNSAQKTLTASNAAIFSGAPGSFELVARKGDLIPTVGKLSSFSGVSRGTAGDHAFISTLTLSALAPVVTSANDQALFAEVAGSISLVAQENTTELLAGLTAVRFGSFYMTSESEVIFQSWVTGTGVTTANDSVLCRWTVGGGIEVLAREGAAAPGTGVNYGGFQALSVSPGGAVALQTTLTNGRIALLRAMPGASLGLVVQTTQTVMFGASSRTILSLGINSTGSGVGGGGGGLGDAINDEGAVFTVLSIGSSDYIARIFRP